MALEIQEIGKDIDPEAKKRVEFTAAIGESMAHIAGLMDDDFAKTPEGNEAAWLTAIIENFIDNNDDFITKFVSGNPGERMVDRMIQELEHPDRKIPADKDLLKKIKNLAETLKKKHIPTQEEWNFFRNKIDQFKNLQTSADLAEFNTWITNILVEIEKKYPDNSAAKIFKNRPKEKLPKLWALNNLKGKETLISYIIENLLTKPRGFNHMREFEQHLEKMLDMKDNTFRKEAGMVRDNEKDEDFPNWFGFHTAVQSKKKKHPIIRALAKAGDKQLVESVLEKAQKGRDEFMQYILAYEKKLTSFNHIAKVENEAKQEIAEIIHSNLEQMKKDIESERQEFTKVMTDRIKALKKAHAKNLAELSKRKEELDHLNKQTLLAANLAESDYKNIRALDKDVDTYLLRVSDIMKIVKTRNILFRLSAGKIDDSTADQEFERIIASGPSEFALKAINQMKSLYETRKSGSIDDNNYNSMMKNIDAFINKMMDQLPVLASNLSRMSHRMVNLASEFDDMKTEMDYYSDRSYRESMGAERWAHKHVPYPRYRDQLSPEEYELLDRTG